MSPCKIGESFRKRVVGKDQAFDNGFGKIVIIR